MIHTQIHELGALKGSLGLSVLPTYFFSLVLYMECRTECTYTVLFIYLPTPCGLWALSTGPGIEPLPSAVKTWSPDHWTARKVSCVFFFF